MVNLVPQLVRAMMQGHAGTADMEAAVGCLEAPFIPTIKAVLAAQTGDAAWRNVRAPFRPADPARAARIATALAAIGSQRAAE